MAARRLALRSRAVVARNSVDSFIGLDKFNQSTSSTSSSPPASSSSISNNLLVNAGFVRQVGEGGGGLETLITMQIDNLNPLSKSLLLEYSRSCLLVCGFLKKLNPSLIVKWLGLAGKS